MGAAVDALSLRNGLDEEHPTGSGDPTEGFSAIAIDLDRRGRETVRMSVGMNPTIAYAKWRSTLRTHERHGRPEEELYDQYEAALNNYVCRRKNASH